MLSPLVLTNNWSDIWSLKCLDPFEAKTFGSGGIHPTQNTSRAVIFFEKVDPSDLVLWEVEPWMPNYFLSTKLDQVWIHAKVGLSDLVLWEVTFGGEMRLTDEMSGSQDFYSKNLIRCWISQ